MTAHTGGKGAIMNRNTFEAYLEKFNAADYTGFLEYYADNFEMIHAGGCLQSREEVMRFYDFLHHYLKETVIVDHFVSDEKMIAIEARVRIEGLIDLSAETIAASDYPGLLPLAKGQVIEIPQFIHYHIVNGKFVKVECRM
jgi:hypothetical protein